MRCLTLRDHKSAAPAEASEFHWAQDSGDVMHPLMQASLSLCCRVAASKLEEVGFCPSAEADQEGGPAQGTDFQSTAGVMWTAMIGQSCRSSAEEEPAPGPLSLALPLLEWAAKMHQRMSSMSNPLHLLSAHVLCQFSKRCSQSFKGRSLTTDTAILPIADRLWTCTQLQCTSPNTSKQGPALYVASICR